MNIFTCVPVESCTCVHIYEHATEQSSIEQRPKSYHLMKYLDITTAHVPDHYAKCYSTVDGHGTISPLLSARPQETSSIRLCVPWRGYWHQSNHRTNNSMQYPGMLCPRKYCSNHVTVCNENTLLLCCMHKQQALCISCSADNET